MRREEGPFCLFKVHLLTGSLLPLFRGFPACRLPLASKKGSWGSGLLAGLGIGCEGPVEERRKRTVLG